MFSFLSNGLGWGVGGGGGADSLGQCVEKELTDRKQPTWRQVLLWRKGWSTNTHLEAGVAEKEGLVNRETNTHLEADVTV